MQDAKESNIVVAYSSPMHQPKSGEARVLRDVSTLLFRRGYNVSAISLSDKPERVNPNGYTETILRRGTETVSSNTATQDNYGTFLSSLMQNFYNQRTILNTSSEMFRALSELKPDIIITSNLFLPDAIDILDLLIRYKIKNKTGKKPKLVVLTDEFRAVPEFFELNRQNLGNSTETADQINLNYTDAEKRHIAIIETIYTQMLYHADAVVYYTDAELNIARTRYDKRLYEKLFRIQPQIDIDPSNNINVRENLRSALFFGKSSNLPNAIAKRKIEEIIAPNVPDVKFVIAGPGGITRTNGNVVSLGDVDNLKSLVVESELYVAPLEGGTGIQTKLLDPIRLGVAILCTPTCAEGYPAVHMGNMIIEKDISRYPFWIGLLQSRELRYGLAHNAKRDMSAYFSQKTVGEAWENLFSTLLQNN